MKFAFGIHGDVKGSGGDDDEILDSGTTWVANEDNGIPICAEFEILERDYEVPGKSIIKITGFFRWKSIFF
mgnify:CR=1 FL=1